MPLSPQRQPDESLSTFRFRYAIFCLKCGIALLVPALLLFFLRPSVDQSPWPLAVTFLYIALPIGLGITVVSMLAFFIGGCFSRYLELHERARGSWQSFRFGVASLLTAAGAIFALYWLFRGLVFGEILTFTRHGSHIVTAQNAPTAFWVSVIGWSIAGFGVLISFTRGKALSRRSGSQEE